jgi:hypothetical protein
MFQSITSQIRFFLLLSFTLHFIINSTLLAQPKPKAIRTWPHVSIRHVEHHGWRDAIIMSNGVVEVIIIPSIGRVMQFRFVDENGPLWENRDLDGKVPDPGSTDWLNFGGDKPWPAPQADWPKITPRAWPPPAGYDASVWQAETGKDFVEIVSPVDAHYGIRARRKLTLHSSKPVLTLTTTFEKVQGEAVKVSVWVITQLQDPQAVFIPVPKKSLYADGYNKQSKNLPQDLKLSNGLLSLTRDRKQSHKIGSDAGTLLWVGEKLALQIDSPRVAGTEYPDQSSSAEVYTNLDPQTYVELEMLGPVQNLKKGDAITRHITWTLHHRTQQNAESEARKILRNQLR